VKDIQRPLLGVLIQRFLRPLTTIQVLIGPRQVGKTTLIHQLSAQMPFKSSYHTADSPAILGPEWIEQHWSTARLESKIQNTPILLCFDEIQKIDNWSEIVKKYFDEDRREGRDIRILLSGSSTTELDTGLSDSLAGRFEKLIATHWTYKECQEAFGVSLGDYFRFGGYPGAYAFMSDRNRWGSYVQNSLIDPIIGKDILMRIPIRKPVLLRQLFILACCYGGQIVSFQKLLGQLQDAGNVTTLSHYKDIIEQALLIAGLPKYTDSQLRKRSSPPKWLPLNTALMTSLSENGSDEWQPGTLAWGRLVEVAVGAHLYNHCLGTSIKVYYWHEAHHEVDFVLAYQDKIIALEVKSGVHSKIKGVSAFKSQYPHAKLIKVGGDGIDLELFFSITPKDLFEI